MANPLHDIAICDLTQNLAGPYCSQILADLGATVIKIEPPGGDLARAWGPPFWGSESALYLSANRGKKSIILDLKSPHGIEVLHRIVRASDVFVQASRPGRRLRRHTRHRQSKGRGLPGETETSGVRLHPARRLRLGCGAETKRLTRHIQIHT